MSDSTNRELARFLFHKILANMKFVLDLEEYSYKDLGRNDPRFKFFKKQLMANTYDMVRAISKELEEWGLLVQADYEEDVKDGYADTPSGGSGYLNSAKLNKIVK